MFTFELFNTKRDKDEHNAGKNTRKYSAFKAGNC